MSPRRIVLNLLAVVAAAATWAMLTASAAQAGSGYINVQYDSSLSPESEVGLLSVTLASSTPLTSLTVSLYQNGADVLDLPMSDFTVPANDGNGQMGAWTLTHPLTTADLSLGTYTGYVTAKDSGGDSVSSVQDGALGFLNVVQFPRFTPDRTSYDYDHQDATFSGTAVLLTPDRISTPLANAPLEFSGPTSGPLQITTNSAGAFAVTVTAQQGVWYWVEYTGGPQTELATTQFLQVTVTSFPVHIAAALAAANVNAGDPDSVSGTVSYLDNGTSKPLGGATVSLYIAPAYSGPPVATTVTDVNGKFTMPVPTTMGSVNWAVASTSIGQYFESGLTGVQLTVAQPNQITGFRATLSRFAVVNVTGCITANTGAITIEYAAKPTGPWLPAGTVSQVYGSSCVQGGNYGREFAGHVIAKRAAAYYRANYKATPNWQQAASTPVYLHRLLTKITNFTVSPRSVTLGGYVSVAGRLWAANSTGRKWYGYGHRKVIVVFRYQGTWYRYRYSPETTSAGRFRHRFKVYATSPFFAQYNGDATHFASASKRITVSAGGASASFPASGSAVRILGR